MQHLPGLAWIKDLEGRYVFANEAAERVFRTPGAELYGRTDRDIFPPEVAAEFMEHDRQALASPRGVQVVESLEHADGVLHHSIVSKFPIRDAAGEPAWVGGMAIDVTEARRTEAALREADRRKTEFLATLAHELRNPLAPIQNSLEILKHAASDPAVSRQSCEAIERQLGQLVRLVDDLLDVGRITSDRLQLRRGRIELGAVIQQAVETCRPAMARRRQTIQLGFPDSPVSLDADAVRLTQVFANLLDNACKYTPIGGTIAVRARQVDETVVISITDSGAGIPPEQLETIFEMFAQLDTSPERSGLGIGLTLVRRLVELHEGSVHARSEGPGTGSEFVVRLPIARDVPDQLPAPAPAAAAPRPPRRILVVDDNRDSTDSLTILLGLDGHETRAAYDGLEAIAVAYPLDGRRAVRPSRSLHGIGHGALVDGDVRGPDVRDRHGGAPRTRRAQRQL
jgi:two-component system CheB/CheR fusion protein